MQSRELKDKGNFDLWEVKFYVGVFFYIINRIFQMFYENYFNDIIIV